MVGLGGLAHAAVTLLGAAGMAPETQPRCYPLGPPRQRSPKLGKGTTNDKCKEERDTKDEEMGGSGMAWPSR
jgi:hypothetical protein